MNSLQLEFVIQQNNETSKKFGGIFNVKTLILKYDSNKYYIVNTSADPSIMGHWVLFIFYKNVLFFIDSLGGTPMNYGGKIYLYYHNFRSEKHVLIKSAIQRNWSLVCGAYTFFFIYKICNNMNPRKILQSNFSRNKYKNDMIVRSFIFKHNKSHSGCGELSCSKHLFFEKCNESEKCSCIHN